MDTLFRQTGLLVTAIQAENARNQPGEESTGRLVVRPALRDQLALQAGRLMIALGEKLTEIGTENTCLSENPA